MYSDDVTTALGELARDGLTVTLTPPRSPRNRDQGYVFITITRADGTRVAGSHDHDPGLQAAWDAIRPGLPGGGASGR